MTTRRHKSGSVPDPETWEKFWAGKRDTDQVYSTSGRIIEALQDLADFDQCRVMEVGAGTGRDSIALAARGATVIVLDYSWESLEITRELAQREGVEVHLLMADALALPLRSSSLDLVFHQGLIEHFRDPRPLLQENYRALGSSGLILVDVPQTFHIYTAIKHILIPLGLWFAGWETEFTIGQLRRLLEEIGFDIRRVYGDWMRPSLGYRMLRELGNKVGLRLPLYPKGPKRLRDIRTRWRAWARKRPAALYTFLDIGAIGSKR